jgi:hypothetical protein
VRRLWRASYIRAGRERTITFSARSEDEARRWIFRYLGQRGLQHTAGPWPTERGDRQRRLGEVPEMSV